MSLAADQGSSPGTRTGGQTASITTARPSSPLRPAPQVTSKDLLAVNASIGLKHGPVVSLNVTLEDPGASNGIQLQASLKIVAGPASAGICSLKLPGGGNQVAATLLSEVTGPTVIKVAAGTTRPLVVQLSPTGTPSQPLGCSVLNPGEQASPPGGTSQSSSPPGAAGTILQSVASVAGAALDHATP
jgi:hypothetical protein